MVSTYWLFCFTILQAFKDAGKGAAERDPKTANAAAERDLAAVNAAAERDLAAANAAAERDKAAALRPACRSPPRSAHARRHGYQA
jgi:hypothetical protein